MSKFIRETVPSSKRRERIDFWERNGFTLINEHTRAYLDGGDDEITLVFELKEV